MRESSREQLRNGCANAASHAARRCQLGDQLDRDDPNCRAATVSDSSAGGSSDNRAESRPARRIRRRSADVFSHPTGIAGVRRRFGGVRRAFGGVRRRPAGRSGGYFGSDLRQLVGGTAWRVDGLRRSASGGRRLPASGRRTEARRRRGRSSIASCARSCSVPRSVLPSPSPPVPRTPVRRPRRRTPPPAASPSRGWSATKKRRPAACSRTRSADRPNRSRTSATRARTSFAASEVARPRTRQRRRRADRTDHTDRTDRADLCSPLEPANL